MVRCDIGWGHLRDSGKTEEPTGALEGARGWMPLRGRVYPGSGLGAGHRSALIHFIREAGTRLERVSLYWREYFSCCALGWAGPWGESRTRWKMLLTRPQVDARGGQDLA